MIELEQALKKVEDQPDKVQPVWTVAKWKLEQYFDRNLSQVRDIFWLSVVVMVAGYACIIFGIWQAWNVPSDMKDSVPMINPAVIGVIAGVITEFIGATFLFIYRSTVEQAVGYTKTLERINSVGMAMQILDTISSDSKELRDQAKSEIAKILLTHIGTLADGDKPSK